MPNVSPKEYKNILKKVGKERIIECDTNSGKPIVAGKKAVTVLAKRNESSLDINTARIAKLHNSIMSLLVQGLEDAIEIGGLLFEQKDIIKSKKGRFTDWVEEFLPFKLRTAQKYMKLYQYRAALSEGKVATITEAYAHIAQERTSDEVIDSDDSLKLPGWTTVESIDLDNLSLPKIKAKGLAKEVGLSKKNIEDFINGPFIKNGQGQIEKIIIKTSGNDLQNIPIQDFVCAVTRSLMPGGKLIFHKK